MMQQHNNADSCFLFVCLYSKPDSSFRSGFEFGSAFSAWIWIRFSEVRSDLNKIRLSQIFPYPGFFFSRVESGQCLQPVSPDSSKLKIHYTTIFCRSWTRFWARRSARSTTGRGSWSSSRKPTRTEKNTDF